MSKKTKVVLAIAALVVIGLATFAFIRPHGMTFGSVSTSCSGYTTCFGDLYVTNAIAGATGALQTTGAAVFGGLLTDNAGILKTNTVSTTTTASETIQVSDVNGYDTIILTPIVGSDTVTLFASSSASAWLPTAGNAQDTCFVNGTTTAGIILTFAGGTGTNIQVASSSATALGALTLYPQKVGCFHFVRANQTATTFDIQAAYTAFK